METRIERQVGEFPVPGPTTQGCGMPAMMAPGQNDMFLLPRIVLVFPEEVQERLASSATRAGVIHGRGRAPSVASPATLVRRRSSQGA